METVGLRNKTASCMVNTRLAGVERARYHASRRTYLHGRAQETFFPFCWPLSSPRRAWALFFSGLGCVLPCAWGPASLWGATVRVRVWSSPSGAGSRLGRVLLAVLVPCRSRSVLFSFVGLVGCSSPSPCSRRVGSACRCVPPRAVRGRVLSSCWPSASGPLLSRSYTALQQKSNTQNTTNGSLSAPQLKNSTLKTL